MDRVRDAQHLGALVRKRRRALGLRQAKLATLAGVSRQWLVELEKGKARAPFNLVMQILAQLGYELRICDVSPSQFASSAMTDTRLGQPTLGRPTVSAVELVKAAVPNPNSSATSSPEPGKPIRGNQIYELSYRKELARLISRVITDEGPLFLHFLAKRIASLHGLSRRSPRLDKLVADLIDGRFPKSDEDKGTIVWPESTLPGSLIPFRKTDRDHADIPLMELASLAKEFLIKGSSEEQTVDDMRRRLDLSNIKSSSRARFRKAINLAKENLSGAI